MKLQFKLALAAIIVSLFFTGAYAQTGTLSSNCIEFKEVKFSYIPKNNYKYDGQKVWLQYTNNCGVDLDVNNFELIGYITKDKLPQNWTYQFAAALFPVKAGAVGTIVANYTATDATFLRIVIRKDSKVLGEKVFEPKDFDKMRAITQQKSKTLDKAPVQPKNLPSLK
ncbi:MAG: hypothetical protein LLF28_05430 [Nitrospiraceae bacterium]|nr:hypothetical protein [Nitrospiraceae bacterium]